VVGVDELGAGWLAGEPGARGEGPREDGCGRPLTSPLLGGLDPAKESERWELFQGLLHGASSPRTRFLFARSSCGRPRPWPRCHR